MAITNTSVVLSVLIMTFGVISIAINIVVILVLAKCKLFHKTDSNIYILATSSIITAICQGLLYVAYLGPSSLLQDFLFVGGLESPFTRLVGFLFHVLWLQDLFMQVTISINRAVIVIFPHMQYLLSRKFTMWMIYFTKAAGIVVALIANYGPMCCSFYLYYASYSYAFIHDELAFNGANYYIDLPINTICSATCISFYVLIYLHIRNTSKKIAETGIEKTTFQSRKNRELRIAFQFFICSGTYIFIWISFRVAGHFIPRGSEQFQVVLTLLHIFHCTANSLVFLIFNKEVRSGFTTVFFKGGTASSTDGVTVVIRGKKTSTKSQSHPKPIS